jgi:hypothetical protein
MLIDLVLWSFLLAMAPVVLGGLWKMIRGLGGRGAGELDPASAGPRHGGSISCTWQRG